MTSVTVAGGSFETPRRMRRLKRAPLTGRQETWLRYGVGVSIAALLAANGVTLASMLADEARDLSGRPRESKPSATADPATEVPATAVSGGFSALEIPGSSIAPAPAPVSTGAGGDPGAPAASPAPASAAPDLSSPGVAVAPVPSATLPPPTGEQAAVPRAVPPAPPGTPPAADVPVTDPSLVGQVVEVVEVVPVVGAPVGDAVNPVVEQVEPVVEDQVVAPVTGVLPAPLGEGLDPALGGIL